MTHQNPNFEDAITSKTIEFHADDDAWYSVSAVMSGDTLTVKYCNFSDVFNERFSVNRFKSVKEVEDFGERFRPVSVQLQDSECRKVIEGVMVCASINFKKEDIRFYDAIVEEVEYKQHSFTKGDEECLCEFMLFWQHGPKAGQLTIASVETICLIQPSIQIDPVVTDFLKKCRDKVTPTSGMSKHNVKREGANQNLTHSAYFSHKSRPKEIKCTKQKAPQGLSPYAVTSVSIPGEWTIEDVDLGGEACFNKKCKVKATKHFLLIDNLEKDLSQSTLLEFLRTQTGVSAEAIVLPSLSSETFTRGVVEVDSKVKLEKLHAFLGNPGHLIVSSWGRPWVISGICSMPDEFGMSLTAMMPQAQKKAMDDNTGNCDEIRIVLLGSEEYTKAKKVKDLVTNFLDHQKRMHATLDLEIGLMMEKSVDNLTIAYEEFIKAASAVIEAHAISGVQRLTELTDASLENLKQRWELFILACDEVEKFVQSLKQRIAVNNWIADEDGKALQAVTNSLMPSNLILSARTERVAQLLQSDLQCGSEAAGGPSHSHRSEDAS